MQSGRPPRWCSDACKARGYREAKAAAAEKERQAEEERAQQAAWERLQEERERWEAEYERRRAEEERAQEEEERAQEEEARAEEERRRAEEERRRRAGSSSSGFRRGRLSTAEARAVLFDLANLRDDGVTTLKTAYRTAARLHHPDHHHGKGDAAFKRLSEAAAVLKDAGLL
ncbi:DnaJ domain-containing protein [Kitasatospora sp. NPDC059648]|uniref:DnaJ domain-containing protein n=1 Tax=Kitasatospora sp. NPDC059648 TaxID=3346894 RepID=UPI00368DE686